MKGLTWLHFISGQTEYTPENKADIVPCSRISATLFETSQSLSHKRS